MPQQRALPMPTFTQLLNDIRACNKCAAHLPHGPRPVLQVHPQARLLIASQAPGRKVHETGVPFNDASGDRLRQWMGVTRDVFYDPTRVAILPMGMCFPGTGNAGDLPPRPECVQTWHPRLLSHLHHIELMLVVGRHAQFYHLGSRQTTLTETVRNWRTVGSRAIPLPHPSGRNNLWLSRNPWFAEELLPALKQRVAEVLGAAA